MTKKYIGDSVYVDFNGYQLILTTENGYEATNTIYLDNEVVDGLIKYVEKLSGKVEVTNG